MTPKKLSLIIGLCLLVSSLSYSQEDKIVQSSELPQGWEYYKFIMPGNIIVHAPILKERFDFLEEKYTSPSEQEKFLIRISYSQGKNLYYFTCYYAGVISGLSTMSKNEQFDAVKKETTGLAALRMTAELFDDLKNLSSGMTTVDSLYLYDITGNTLLILDIGGYQKKALRKGEVLNLDEAKAAIQLMKEKLKIVK